MSLGVGYVSMFQAGLGDDAVDDVGAV